MFGFNPIRFVFRILRGADNPREVAAGIALGFFIGLTPGWPLHILLAALLILILNVNLTAAILATGLAVSLSWLLDPVINSVGELLLEDISGLQGLWTWAYNNPIMAWTRFNNTMVMGALVLGLIGALAIFFIGSKLLIQYQTQILEKIKSLPLFKSLVNSQAAHLYYWLAGRD